MSAPSTVYLVSGSNRGIGLGFVEQILNTENSFVYAGARDPESSLALIELKAKHPDRISIVKLISADIEGNKSVANEIQTRHGRVDTVIANAAIGENMDFIHDVDPASLDKHFQVNVTGVVVLFQALYDLLKASNHPRFVPISSGAGSLSGPVIDLPMGCVAYGATKAALNWVSRKIHFENEWLVAFPLSPGVVDTEMMRKAKERDSTGTYKDRIEKIPNIPTPDEAAALLLDIVARSTRENEGGQFVHIDGTHLPW